MPINVFGYSSNNFEHKNHTSIFVQNFYLRTNYMQSNIKDDLDLKNQ